MMGYLAALLPVAIYIVVVYSLDSFSLVSIRRLLSLILIGAAAALVCFGLFYVTGGLVPESLQDYTDPFIEELFKAIPLLVLARSKKTVFFIDSIICGAAVGGGFSILENIFYVVFRESLGVGTLLFRGLEVALIHMGCSAIISVALMFSVRIIERVRFHDPGTLQGRDLHNPAAELLCEISCVQLIAVLFDHIHHIDGYDNRNAQFNKLGGQVQVAFQVCAVNDIQDRVGTLVNQVIPGYHFFQRIGRKTVDTRQVRDGDAVMLFQFSFLLFHGDAGPVSDKLVGTRQGVEERCFTTVWIARQGDSDIHDASILLF